MIITMNSQDSSRRAQQAATRASSLRVHRNESRNDLPRSIVEAVAAGNRPMASELLLDLARREERNTVRASFLEKTADALETGAWAFFSDSFAKGEFLGARGEVVIVAPYTARRMGVATTELSAIFGKVLPYRPLPDPRKAIIGLFGELKQNLSVVTPLLVTASAGAVGDERGEAFIVPDGWPGVKSGKGPALNNMKEQRRRFTDSGEKCIWSVFEPRSAEFLTRPLRNQAKAIQVQHSEYQMHDFGHACGLGLELKLEQNLLSSPFYRAVEEFRADGVGLELAARLMSEDHAAELIASNLCTRLGLDAQRLGGMDTDTDVLAALLTFHHLVQSEAIQIGPSGRLAFTDHTPIGLLRAMEFMRAEAVKLTRRELDQNDPCAIWRLYALEVPHATEMLFEQYVRRPCAGMYSDLR